MLLRSACEIEPSQTKDRRNWQRHLKSWAGFNSFLRTAVPSFPISPVRELQTAALGGLFFSGGK